MSGRIRVVIVDDHAMVRTGLRLMLEEEGGDIDLVGDAADGVTALALVGELQPDVVVLDIRMPGLDGLATLARIRAAWPQIAVLLLTTYDEDELLLRGLRAGAYGYLLKDAPLETLLAAIRSAAQGVMLLQPGMMARVLACTAAVVAPAHAAAPRERSPQGGLTKREREVLAGVAQGERTKEIAGHLGIAERTVRAYLDGIYTN